MNDRLFYVFHCNIAIGAIFSGSQDECRAYVLSQPQLLVSSIITDEDEYQMLSNMPDKQIRKYFDNLKELAKSYISPEPTNYDSALILASAWLSNHSNKEASHDADECDANEFDLY